MDTCTVLYFSLSQHSAPCESCICLWSTRIVRQESENTGTPQNSSVSNCGCDQHVKQAPSVLLSGQGAGSLKTKGRKFQYQPVDLGVLYGMSFPSSLSPPPPGTLDLSEGEKLCLTYGTGRHMRGGQVRRENYIEIRSAAGWGQSIPSNFIEESTSARST